MLVLTRQPDDSILIGDEVEITILEIKGKTVKLGVTAPPEIPVHRSEVYVKFNGPLSLLVSDSETN